jgi:hypothetical protein
MASQRQQWLAQSLVRWEARLRQAVDAHWRPAQGWPNLPRGRQLLARWLQTLRKEAQASDEALAVATQRVQRAQQQHTAAAQTLAAACRLLPGDSPWQVLAALAQPWRWPAWLWTYFVLLPGHVQALRNAQNAVLVLCAEEAGCHLVRQLRLAQQQDVQREIALGEQREALLAEAGQALADALAQAGQALPAPWTPPQLAALADALHIAERVSAGAGLEAGAPAALWTVESAAGLAAGLVDVLAAVQWGVENWSALDCLAAAQPADETALARWLADWLASADPLWPHPELHPGAVEERWLLLPGQPGALNLAQLRACLAGHLALAEGIVGFDTLLALHWIVLCDEIDALST